jgi:hypothetical protein
MVDIAAVVIPGRVAFKSEVVGLGARNPWSLCATRQNSMANGGARGAGGRLIRIAHVATHDISGIALKYTNTYNGTNGETPNTNAIGVAGAIEYPSGTCYAATFGGRAVAQVDGGGTVTSDAIGVSIPAGAVFYERGIVQESAAPVAAAAGGSGGALAAATYFYKVTAVNDLGESGPSAEVSATVSASGSVTLTLTDKNVLLPARSYRIYRSTVTNTEVFLAAVVAAATWTDTGAIPAGAGSPPAAPVVPYGIQLSSTYQSEGQIFAAVSLAQMLAASPGFGSVNSTCFSACSIFGLGVAPVPSVAIAGDSIPSGTGDTGYTGRTAGDCGFAVRALDAALIPHISLSQGSETLANFQGTQRQNRMSRMIGVRHAIVSYGTNSLATVSVANMQASILEIARAIKGIGTKVWWCTLTPKTTSSDSWMTAANQTPLSTTDAVDATYNSPELRRQAINAWLRDPGASGFVTQLGGAQYAGLFDVAATVEVDAANALAPTGGRWRCATPQTSTFFSTTDGVHPSTAGHVLMQAGVITASLT